MRRHGNTDLKIAERHFELLQLARRRLPYGISKVTLPSGSVWEMSGTTEEGEAFEIRRNIPSFKGLLASEELLPEAGGKRDLRLTISVRPNH
jgi:hypothetical protein